MLCTTAPKTICVKKTNTNLNCSVVVAITFIDWASKRRAASGAPHKDGRCKGILLVSIRIRVSVVDIQVRIS